MRRLLTAAALVPVLALSACGDSTEPAATAGSVNETHTPVEVLRLAGTTTTQAGSAKTAMTMEGAGVKMTGHGVTSLSETKGEMTMNMDAGGQKMEMKMVMLGDIIYMKMPTPHPGAPGKPWMKFDIATMAKQGGLDAASLQQFRNADPSSMLAYFSGVSDDVKEVGRDTVRGEATTKYTTTFDMRKIAASVKDPKARQALEQSTAQLGTMELPATIWIDDEGRMRKMVQKLDMSKATVPGASGTMTMTFELYDFGTEVDVEAPPADQVGDAPAMPGGAGG